MAQLPVPNQSPMQAGLNVQTTMLAQDQLRGQIADERKRRQDEAALKQQTEQDGALFSEAYQMGMQGDNTAMDNLLMTRPDIHQKITEQFGLNDTNQAKNAMGQAAQLKHLLESGNVEGAMQFYSQLGQSGSMHPMLQGLADNFQTGDITGAIKEMNMGYSLFPEDIRKPYGELFGRAETKEAESIFGNSVTGRALSILSDPNKRNTREYQVAETFAQKPTYITDAVTGDVTMYQMTLPEWEQAINSGEVTPEDIANSASVPPSGQPVLERKVPEVADGMSTTVYEGEKGRVLKAKHISNNKSTIVELDDNLALIDEIINHPSLGTYFGKVVNMPIIGGTDLADLDAKMKRLGSINLISGIKSMKESGGGAQFSEREAAEYKKAIAALERGMPIESVSRELKRLYDKMKGLRTKASDLVTTLGGESALSPIPSGASRTYLYLKDNLPEGYTAEQLDQEFIKEYGHLPESN